MSTRKTLILTLTAAAVAGTALFGAGLAQARQGYGPQGPILNFEELDTNGDGQITQDEMQARAKTRFDDADTNGDGKLSVEEMTATAEKRMQDRMQRGADKIAKRTERMIEKRDANGDGLLTMAELEDGNSRGDRLFERLDKDGDGVISAEEFEAMQKRMMKRGGKQKGNH